MKKFDLSIVTPFNRYDKDIIESFSLAVIANSFDNTYASMIKPNSTDDFDFVSVDGRKGLEVSLVIPENEQQAYEYEKILKKSERKPDSKRVKNARVGHDGALISYYGGGMGEIRSKIIERIKTKHEKALKRLSRSGCQTVDLCLCVADGSLFNLDSYKMSFDNLDQFVFDNIFIITPAYFIRYNKTTGFEEYKRII